MGKLVVFKLGEGSCEQGFPIMLQIGEDGDRPSTEIAGKLPPSPEIVQQYKCWQAAYYRLGLRSRLEAAAVQITNVSVINDCIAAVKVLKNSLNNWLHAESFRLLRERFLEKLMPTDEVRIILQTDDALIQKLPWHLCDLFERYPYAEIALSAPVYEGVKQASFSKPRIKILAILGNSAGINIHADRVLLEKLPEAEIKFLVEPQRHELNNQLWTGGWDILFFAGHSACSANGENSSISINQTDSLTISDVKYALQIAVQHGLKLAIFNSCDGLGLARDLAVLQIPQVIVMREPVPDRIAQEFLKYFLQAFAGDKSFYLAVREAREKLQGLEDQFPCATWLPIIYQNPAELPPTWRSLRNPMAGKQARQLPKSARCSLDRVFLLSIMVTSLVVGIRHWGMLQSLELQAFDRLTQLKLPEGPDRRLLVVSVTEADIQAQSGEPGQGSLSDTSLQRLLQKLEQFKPRAIGLDIYRPLPLEPGYVNLSTAIKNNDRLLGVCKVSDPGINEIGIPAPPEIPQQRLGFSDVVIDDDSYIVRRQLLHLTPTLTSQCQTKYALSLQLALHYLDAEGIQPTVTPEGYLKFDKVVLERLKARTGGYQKLDARGYQLLLNYRPFKSLDDIAPQVTLGDILNNRLSPELIKELENRIILIGVTAPSASDYWFTPYSASLPSFQKQIPGVFLQAQMVSQILSAVLDRRSLIWVMPAWGEILWIWSWSVVGGILVWQWRSLLRLGIGGGLALVSLYGLCFVVLTGGGWIPLVPSALSLVATAGAVVFYRQFNNNSKPLELKLNR